MNKYSPLLFVMAFSFLFGDANVQIRLQNGQKVQGEFVGTYMNHVHILVEEKIIYYACDDITSITYADGGFSYGKGYDYDCSKNTVTADILFPPELDPMTGEMTQMLPDVFNPETRELIKDQNDTDGIDIWNKKIPPSVYFEKISKEWEVPYRGEICSWMFLCIGISIPLLGPESTTGFNLGGSGKVMGTAFLAGGLYMASRILRIGPKGLKWIPQTDAGEQFENIKNIQDKNEKEKLAYESLVALAQISRIEKDEIYLKVYGKPVDDELIGLSLHMANREKWRIQMTTEEKALDDYLNQIPIMIGLKIHM